MICSKTLVAALLLASTAGGALAATTPQIIQADAVDASKAAPTVPAERRLTAEEKTLEAIKAEGRAAVEALVGKLSTATDAQDRVRLQREIESAKLQSRARLLQKIIDFAQAKGDHERATQVSETLRVMLNGPEVEGRKVSRPAPHVSNGGK